MYVTSAARLTPMSDFKLKTPRITLNNDHPLACKIENVVMINCEFSCPTTELSFHHGHGQRAMEAVIGPNSRVSHVT